MFIWQFTEPIDLRLSSRQYKIKYLLLLINLIRLNIVAGTRIKDTEYRAANMAQV